MAVLLTGVGYIGSVLLDRLLARGEQVVGLENYYSTPRDALARWAEADRFALVEGDVSVPGDVARAFDLALALTRGGEPLRVYHLAAQPSAAMAEREPAYTERANLTGARLVLEAARDRGARVVFGGSFRVYGDELAGGTVDEQTPYGRTGDLSHLSKIYVEQLGRMLGVPFVSVRLGVVYGVAPVMKLQAAFMTAPNLFCQRAARGEVLQVLQDRPLAFIHVEDAADALLAAERLLESGEAWQVANAAPEVLGIGQVAREVQRSAHQRGRFVRIHGASSEDNVEPAFRVSTRLDAAGFAASRRMDEGLRDVLGYFLSPVGRSAAGRVA